MSQMLCLYCDRPLALLKRLTGDGEFCSKEHRRIYQKEHNQLGLARLLESQPANKGKRPANPPSESPAPDHAGHLPDFMPGARAVSVANRSTASPRFQRAAPILSESESPQVPQEGSPRQLPRLAACLPELPELLCAGKVDGSHSVAPGSSRTAQRAVPRFSPLVPVRAGSGLYRSSPAKLSLAAFVSAPAGARSNPGRIQSHAVEPRWKPLAAAVPTRPIGKIVLVLGSFLRRPVRIAGLDSVPESFEIRLRPISFPRYSPRMGVLEERPRQIDRIRIPP